jgi:hypothetical protein
MNKKYIAGTKRQIVQHVKWQEAIRVGDFHIGFVGRYSQKEIMDVVHQEMNTADEVRSM